MNPTDTTRANIQSALEQLVRDIGGISPSDTDFSPHSELFDSGYLDSLGIVSLTAYIEQQFGVNLTEEHLFDQRFTSIIGITEIITSSPPIAPRTED